MMRSTAKSDTAVGMYSKLPLPSAAVIGQKTQGRSLKTTGVVCHFVGYALPIQSPSVLLCQSRQPGDISKSTHRRWVDSCWSLLPKSCLAVHCHHQFQGQSLQWLFYRTSHIDFVEHPSSCLRSVVPVSVEQLVNSLIARKFLNAHCRRARSSTTADLVVVF